MNFERLLPGRAGDALRVIITILGQTWRVRSIRSYRGRELTSGAVGTKSDGNVPPARNALMDNHAEPNIPEAAKAHLVMRDDIVRVIVDRAFPNMAANVPSGPLIYSRKTL